MAEADPGVTAFVVSRERLVAAALRDFSLGATAGWRSHDPYDVLLSPFARRIPSISPFAARVVLQVGRRSGVGVRRLLRVPPHEEPKALSDFLRAAVTLGRTGEAWAAEYVSELSARLRERAVPTRTGYGWGITFPWVSRYVALAAGEPNIYTTTVACQALLDDYELAGREKSLQMAVLGARFILRELGSFTYGGSSWLRYGANSADPVVNVQASASSLFARVGPLQQDDELLEAADRAAQAVVATQRDDGSWTYSVDGRGDFVDGFHTGFTLQGLLEYASLRGEVSVDAALTRGFAYFKEHLLTGDGRPRAFADGAASRDGQTLAQAIQTLVLCGRGSDTATAARIWLLSNEQRQRARFLALRWDVAPFALATAYLVQAMSES
jgi:hypothetical protein